MAQRPTGNWKGYLNELSQKGRFLVTYKTCSVPGLGPLDMFKCTCSTSTNHGTFVSTSDRHFTKIDAEQEAAYNMIKLLEPHSFIGEANIFVPQTSPHYELIRNPTLDKEDISQEQKAKEPTLVPKLQTHKTERGKLFYKNKMANDNTSSYKGTFSIHITEDWYQQFHVTNKSHIHVGDICEEYNYEWMMKDDNSFRYPLNITEQQRDKIKEMISIGEDLIDICTAVYGVQTYVKEIDAGYKSKIPNTSYYVNKNNTKATYAKRELSPEDIGLLYLIN